MKNWFCWIPCYFAETTVLESLVGVLSLSANRHNQLHKVSWEHWAVIGGNLFAYFWADTEHFYRVTIWTLGFKMLYARHLWARRRRQREIGCFKADFGFKIFLVIKKNSNSAGILVIRLHWVEQLVLMLQLVLSRWYRVQRLYIIEWHYRTHLTVCLERMGHVFWHILEEHYWGNLSLKWHYNVIKQ